MTVHSQVQLYTVLRMREFALRYRIGIQLYTRTRQLSSRLYTDSYRIGIQSTVLTVALYTVTDSFAHHRANAQHKLCSMADGTCTRLDFRGCAPRARNRHGREVASTFKHLAPTLKALCLWALQPAALNMHAWRDEGTGEWAASFSRAVVVGSIGATAGRPMRRGTSSRLADMIESLGVRRVVALGAAALAVPAIRAARDVLGELGRRDRQPVLVRQRAEDALEARIARGAVDVDLLAR